MVETNRALKKPMNMAFIEEEDDEALAEYHQQAEDDGTEIVTFMQGYRRSRENTPEEHQFVSSSQASSSGQQPAIETLMLPPNQFDMHTQLELEEAEYRARLERKKAAVEECNESGYAPPEFHRVYHQGSDGESEYSSSATPLQDSDATPLQDYDSVNSESEIGFVQMHGENNDVITDNTQGGGIPGNEEIPLGSIYPSQDTPDDSIKYSHPGQNTPNSYYGNNGTPDSLLQGTISPEYDSSCRSSLYAESTDDDVELPPHLCGSVTPERVHEFLPQQQPQGPQMPVPVPSLFYYLPGAMRPPIPTGPLPRGRRPMGHNVINTGRQLPNQQFMFDPFM